MKKKKISETTKKHNEEIIERMKKAVNVKNYIDLTINSDITKSDISHFKSEDTGTFYKKIIDFCVKHNVNVIWLIDGVGEMFIQTPQDTANTPEERDLTSKLLTILRHGPDEEMKTVFGNLVSTYYTAYSRAAGNLIDKTDPKGGELAK